MSIPSRPFSRLILSSVAISFLSTSAVLRLWLDIIWDFYRFVFSSSAGTKLRHIMEIYISPSSFPESLTTSRAHKCQSGDKHEAPFEEHPTHSTALSILEITLRRRWPDGSQHPVSSPIFDPD
ncbi:hypothetical protein B0H11DRAFT_1938691 [Mycena galericulata]|nr:hypothetical protein B0H11DRAFT_1938691 [Mycena galericulata]